MNAADKKRTCLGAVFDKDELSQNSKLVTVSSANDNREIHVENEGT